MRAEAEVTYRTIFLPTIMYPFPATNLSATILEKAQSMTTPVILSHMGYNQNMPKAVVYAPTTVGGLGFHQLSTEQGLQKIIHLIKHLWTNTTLGNLMEAAIKVYQIQAGIPISVLEYTAPLPWKPQCWIANLQESLHNIQGQIVLESPWTILALRQNDTHIMLDLQQARYSIKQLKILNNCQLFLQVTTLTEITNHAGTHLLPKALKIGRTTPHQSVQLCRMALSM